MAKTPLMHALQRLAADYRLAHAHRLPLHAIRELRAAAHQRTQEASEHLAGLSRVHGGWSVGGRPGGEATHSAHHCVMTRG